MDNEDFEISENPNLAEVSTTPPRFKYTPEEEALVAPILAEIASAIAVAELPDYVKDHPFYPPVIQGTLHRASKRDFKNTHRNRARFVPERPNEDIVQNTLRDFAINIFTVLEAQGVEVVMEKKEIAILSIQKALNLHLRRNLEAIAEEPIFYLGKRRKKGTKEIFTSTKEIKEAVKKVQVEIIEGRLERSKANVALLLELEAIDNTEIRLKGRKRGGSNGGKDLNLEDYNLEILDDEIKESMDWAFDHCDKKLEWMNKLITRYMAEEKFSGEFDRLSIKDALRFDDLFELLTKLFDSNTSTRDANDIQIVLNLALMHWTWERAFESIKKTRLKEIEKKVMGGLFKEDGDNSGRLVSTDVAGPILRYIDDMSNPHFEVITGSSERVPVYTLKPLLSPRGKTILIHSYKMKPKPTDSGVGKHLDEDQGKMIPEKVSDYFRTRFVLWNISSQEIHNDTTLKTKLTEALQKIAETLDLKDIRIKEPKEGDKFVKWQLTGRTQDGIPVEVQMIPHDTYLFEHAHNSGIGHEDFGELRDIDRWQVQVPPSISQKLHDSFILRKQQLVEKRERTQKAMKTFDYSQVKTLPKALN